MKSDLWRSPDFLKLWAGQAISRFGSIITRDALPFAAMLTLGASPFQMGMLSGAGAAVLVFGPFAGAWVDRLRRRPLLIASDLARSVLLGSIPLAFVLHRLTMWHLYTVEAAAAVLTLLFDAAHQAYVPEIVSTEKLVETNSRLAVTQSIAEVSGPGFNGSLVQMITAPVAILIDAISYIGSAFALGLIRKAEKPLPRRPGRSLRKEIAEGIRFSWSNATLRPLFAFAATGAFCMGFYSALYVIFAIRELHLTPALLGIVISAGGAANLGGALFSDRLIRRFGVGNALAGSAFLLGCAALLPPLAGGPIWASAGLLTLAQVFDGAWPVFSVCQITIRQSTAPEHLRGRVNSAMDLIFRGVLPLGAITGGLLAETIGMRSTLMAGGIGFLLSSCWFVCAPLRTVRIR